MREIILDGYAAFQFSVDNAEIFVPKIVRIGYIDVVYFL